MVLRDWYLDKLITNKENMVQSGYYKSRIVWAFLIKTLMVWSDFKKKS